MHKYLKLFIAVAVCELIGIAGTPFTIASVQTWYQTLNKPFFSPPNWIFGPVWTILYLMMGIAAFLIWEKGLKSKKVKTALKYFLVQLMCNFLWSIIFFGLHAPFVAFIDILVLWIAILLTIMQFYKLSKPSAYLLIPYLAWVSFATLLNGAIVLLN